MSLVPFAGAEIEPPKRGPSNQRTSAYHQFKSGKDTLQIAAAFNVPEATILYWLNERRSLYRRLPSPYRSART